MEEISDCDFDVITLFEVIEHVAKPVEFVEQLRQFLKPDGYLVIGTDNFDSSVVHTLENNFLKWIPHQHISLFDDKSLPKLVERCGFTIETARSFTPWEFVMRSGLYRLTRGRKGGKPFSLDAELATENSRHYKLFKFRRMMNSLWYRVSSKKNLKGEMMFLLARMNAASN